MANEQRQRRRSVLMAHFSTGIRLGSAVISGFPNASCAGATAELHPGGVLLRLKGRDVLVPMSNVIFAELGPDES
jgi:hypothetical protein